MTAVTVTPGTPSVPAALIVLWGTFSRRERRAAAGLSVLVVVSACLEAAGVASVLPFMALMADPATLDHVTLAVQAREALGLQSPRAMLFAVGVAVFALLVLTNAVSALANWLLVHFANRKGHGLSLALLEAYAARPYVFFLERNSSEMVKTVFTETYRVTSGVLLPGAQLLSRGLAAVLILGLLVAVDARLALLVGTVLGGAYAVVYALSRGIVSRAGSTSVSAGSRRATSATELLQGIKEIKLLGREGCFLDRYGEASREWADAQSVQQAAAALPRYAVEALAFGGVVLMSLVLLGGGGDPAGFVPVLALYAFAGYRLMPALQQIFVAATSVRFSAPALAAVLRDLPAERPSAPAAEAMAPMREGIEVCDLRIVYPGAARPSLEGVSLSIPRNATVAFVGSTGSGKSTLADAIMGLLEPSQGQVLVDGRALSPDLAAGWQRRIGHVPQQVFLADDSLAANVALGVPRAEVDPARVRECCRIANLWTFVESLPDGPQTLVGERGARLSGGQRQRIGIARALYHDPDLMVFDEATSALDAATEATVMEAIASLAGRKTIVLVAHRLSTVRMADVVHVLAAGRIVASGSYERLVAESGEFRRLAAWDVA